MWSPQKHGVSLLEADVVQRRPDAVSLLTLYVLLIVAIPSRLTVAALGAAGTPAQIVGLLALAWWIFYEIQRTSSDPYGSQPVRTAYILMGCAFLASYVAAMTRAIDATESSSADLGMVATAAWGGVLLLASDGIASLERLMVLLKRIAMAGGAVATLGIVQFATGEAFVDRIDIPGLRANIDIAGLALRNGFNRPSGTALHPIEFGSVLAMILPIALTFAINDRSRNALRRWFPVAAIGMASVMSISRSALLAALVALIVVGVAWKPRARLLGAGAFAVFGGAVFLTVPGLLGSLLGLFTGISDDSSAQSRTGSYSIAGEFIARAPIFGRGLMTFLPRYRILDNQYLGLLIDVGIVGLLTFVALIVAGLWCARAARRVADDELNRQLGQATIASIAAGAVGLAFFDGFSFPMSAGLFFMIIGISGAMWRLARQHQAESLPSLSRK